MDYALIKNGAVQNVIVADESFVELISSDWDHITPVIDGAGIGWEWNGGFVPPPSPPVEEPA